MRNTLTLTFFTLVFTVLYADWHHASAQYAQAQVQHVAYRADFWSSK